MLALEKYIGWRRTEEMSAVTVEPGWKFWAKYILKQRGIRVQYGSLIWAVARRLAKKSSVFQKTSTLTVKCDPKENDKSLLDKQQHRKCRARSEEHGRNAKIAEPGPELESQKVGSQASEIEQSKNPETRNQWNRFSRWRGIALVSQWASEPVNHSAKDWFL